MTTEETRMRGELDAVYGRCYRDLLRSAARMLRRDRNSPLGPSTLVHEAWLRLSQSPEFADTSEAHFRAIAVRAMRNLMVDAARRRNAQRRGGPRHFTVSLHEDSASVSCSIDKLLDAERALLELRARNPRHEAVLELAWFGGYTAAEIALSLSISETAVKRDLRFLKTWRASLWPETNTSATHAEGAATSP